LYLSLAIPLENNWLNFIVFNKGTIAQAVQVCYHLDQDNLERELSGMIEVLEFFKLKRGTIVTLDQNERLERKGLVVDVVTCDEWIK